MCELIHRASECNIPAAFSVKKFVKTLSIASAFSLMNFCASQDGTSFRFRDGARLFRRRTMAIRSTDVHRRRMNTGDG